MAIVYILYSTKLNKYYIGSCEDLGQRFQQHKDGVYSQGFTRKANDWEIFYELDNLEYSQARKIESHIKRMKSKRYIESLRDYPAMQKSSKIFTLSFFDVSSPDSYRDGSERCFDRAEVSR